MADMPQSDARAPSDKSEDRVDVLATRALSVVASRTRRPMKSLDAGFMELLHAAALRADGVGFTPLVAQMREAGIRADEIADHYIPALARRLGELWCEDELGFASVTIGVARLQGLLRELGPAWRADLVTDSDAPTLLVVVAEEVYHTLGAMVLSGQLRRMGLSVRLMIGANISQIGPAMRRVRYDAVLISASYGETLESMRKIVEQIKSSTTAAPPVVIGGTVLETALELGADIKVLTGADHATNDPVEALALCGLDLRPYATSGRTRRT
jgi:MerR family transcriptional regulator, light-induced transcriptional regulator